MESIREIFKIGKGPSSSHTMGPRKAALDFKANNPTATRFEVTLYGSLAATGKGHLTDTALLEVLGEDCKINWLPETFLPQHPNGILFEAFSPDNKLIDHKTTFSIGGGDISDTGKRLSKEKIYPHSTMTQILNWCKDNGTTFWEYVEEYEGSDIYDYLFEVWKVMKAAVERGLDNEGVLPGGLKLARKASSFYIKPKVYRDLCNAGQ
jgi:L-serine deaminase